MHSSGSVDLEYTNPIYGIYLRLYCINIGPRYSNLVGDIQQDVHIEQQASYGLPTNPT